MEAEVIKQRALDELIQEEAREAIDLEKTRLRLLTNKKWYDIIWPWKLTIKRKDFRNDY